MLPFCLHMIFYIIYYLTILFILHVKIGKFFSLMKLEIIIYGLVRKCVKLPPSP